MTLKTTDYVSVGTTYWIAHGNENTLHYGILEDGQRLSTGQPFFEHFSSRRQWMARVFELGGDPNTVNQSVESVE